MRARCKAFEAHNCAELEQAFNSWYEAMEASVDSFVIVQSHLAHIEGGALLVVFWAPAPVTQ